MYFVSSGLFEQNTSVHVRAARSNSVLHLPNLSLETIFVASRSVKFNSFAASSLNLSDVNGKQPENHSTMDLLEKRLLTAIIFYCFIVQVSLR